MKWIKRLFSLFGILPLPAVFVLSGLLLACIGVMICMFTKAQNGGPHVFPIALALIIPSLLIGIVMLVIAMEKEECRPHDAEPMQKEQVKEEKHEEEKAHQEKRDEKHEEKHEEKHAEPKKKSSLVRTFLVFAFVTVAIIIIASVFSSNFAIYARSIGRDTGIKDALADLQQQPELHFSDLPCDTNQWNYLHRNVWKIEVDASMGCYWGNVRLPANWGVVRLKLIQHQGGQLRIWCAGKVNPSRTYFGNDTEFEQKDIDSCYLNGRDVSMTFRIQGTPGSKILIEPVTLIQGVPMPLPEKETDN